MSACLLVFLVPAMAVPQSPPARGAEANLQQTLLANEKSYQEAKAEEKQIEGLLEINPGSGKIGLSDRFCSFRFSWVSDDGKASALPIYMAGKDARLGPFLGYRVRITGKVVEGDAQGVKTTELWPASLEVLEQSPFGVIGELKIIARTHAWTPSRLSRQQQYPVPFVIRDGKELAIQAGIGNVPNPEQDAMTQIGRLLGLVGPQPRIDWQMHMIICISGGQRFAGSKLDITRVAVQEKTLDVYWWLSVSQDGASYPIETILIKRFDGEIRFHQLGATTKPIVIPAVTEAKPGGKP
jgi:hypothetical protein